MDTEPIHPHKKNLIKVGTVYGVPILFCIALMVMLNVSSPLSTGPAGILLIFGLLYLSITTVLFACVHASSVLFGFFGMKKFHVTRHTYYLISIMTLWPLFLLALNTLGRLEIIEIILVTILVALGCFYVSRRKSAETHE